MLPQFNLTAIVRHRNPIIGAVPKRFFHPEVVAPSEKEARLKLITYYNRKRYRVIKIINDDREAVELM